MSAENVKDIHEVLASIEALNEEAGNLNRKEENQDNIRETDFLPVSLVAETNARKADVVLLDDVYRKGTSQQEQKANTTAPATHQKKKTQSAPELKLSPSDAEFDQMLSSLMREMEYKSKEINSTRGSRLSAKDHRKTSEFTDLTNLKADIDGLLSPYLNISAAQSKRQRITDSKSSYRLNAEEQSEPQERDRQKDLSDETFFSAIVTDAIRAEIADFILAEIKLQISGWIAENLENIIEDALRSVSTEARDALRARSVR